jgi:L-ribulokinase
MNKQILVPQSDVTSLGSAIFAFLAAGTFQTVEEAQDALCPSYLTVEPDAHSATMYQDLFGMFQRLYFAMGRKNAEAMEMGNVLPALRHIAARARDA